MDTNHQHHMNHNENRTDRLEQSNHDMNEHNMDAHAEKPVQIAHVDHSAHTAHANMGLENSIGYSVTNSQDAHAGHGANHQEHNAHVDHSGHENMFRRRFWISLVLSIPVLLYSEMIQEWLSFSMPVFPASSWIEPFFASIVFIFGGIPFLQMALPEIKNRLPGMMTLISLAISVAYGYSLAALFLPTESSFFWELVTLIDIMLLGHWLEMRSVRQASGALNELARLMPDTAERILSNGSTEIVPLAKLRMGDLVLVRPGASLPSDGEVREGESEVNEAMITGESKPVKKAPGDPVIAGTINGEGSLRVSVTATGDNTALAGIMRLVEQAQQSKSNTQILADRAAGWLFYLALAIAVITAVAWTMAVGFNVDVVARVATVLVIACPHALGLAVPLVVAITTAMGAQNGILVRDRLALETARQINTVVFDKTGTLTRGEFGVVGIQTTKDWSEDKVLSLAAAIEGDSEHTIARGIRQTAVERGLVLPNVNGFEAIKGRGVHAEINGQRFFIGGPRLLEMLTLQPDQATRAFEQQASGKGQSVVYLVQDGKENGQILAAFTLADVIRPESRQAVARLHELGIAVAMLTGDSKAVAKTVADDLGIDHYYAEVLPEDKDQKVAELQRQGKRVAMVGDGVNDAPALTRADVGIAIGGGTDVAIESAGIILVKNNPLDVVKIFDLSRASYRKMIENLIWATGYNVVTLPLAAGILAPFGILLSPAVGAVLMSLSTIVVAINAQLLRRHSLAG